MNGSTGNQRRNLKEYNETNENESMMVQNLWDAAKEVLSGKYIVIQAYLKKKEKSQATEKKYNNNFSLKPAERK